MVSEADGTRRGRGGAVHVLALQVLALLILVLLATAVMVAQQRGAGAFEAEASATHPAEARHFVTSLMIADHWAAGRPALEGFAADYRLRLPVALAPTSWSLFHLVQGAWLAALGPVVPVALLLAAVLAALLLVATGAAGASVAGVLPGVAAAFLLAASPLFKAATLEVGLDLPLALTLVLAALAFGRVAERGTRGDAALFTLAGIAAVATAPAGAVALLIPPVASVLAGRGDLLRRGVVLVPLAALTLLSLVLALVWGARPVPEGAALTAAWVALRDAFGLLPLVLAGAGFAFVVGAGWRGDGEARRAAPVAALIVAWACALALGAGEGRALDALSFAAPVAVLAAFGAVRLLGFLVSGWVLVRGLAVALLLLSVAMPGLLREVRKQSIGMDRVAEAFLAQDAGTPVIVVAGDPAGEAALVAAVAQRDRAGRAFVIEAQSLKRDGADADGFLTALDETGAAALAIEATPAASGRASVRAAQAAVEAHPDRFRLAGTFARGDTAGEVRLYAIARASTPPADPAAAVRRATRPAS